MNIFSILSLFAAISADLIAWNRYSGLVSKKFKIENNNDLISHQDAIIRQLMKNNRYAELRSFIKLVRQSHIRREQLMMH